MTAGIGMFLLAASSYWNHVQTKAFGQPRSNCGLRSVALSILALANRAAEEGNPDNADGNPDNAVAVGQLGWKRRPDNLRQLQAAAAVGQAYLIRAYDEGLRRHRRHAAQLLLTHEDFDSRPRYLNMRNTLHALFECDAVPVINENDTISVDEIKFGDNDRLAAMVTNLLQAPLLIILSVVDGLYRGEPGGSTVPDLVSMVPQIDDEVIGLAGLGKSSLGTGGMQSKLAAA